MQTGTIKRVNGKGFCFIECDNGDRDVFAHFNQLASAGFETPPAVGTRAQFDTIDTPKGPKVNNLRPATDNE
jgi:CspA family cold shock protein